MYLNGAIPPATRVTRNARDLRRYVTIIRDTAAARFPTTATIRGNWFSGDFVMKLQRRGNPGTIDDREIPRLSLSLSLSLSTFIFTEGKTVHRKTATLRHCDISARLSDASFDLSEEAGGREREHARNLSRSLSFGAFQHPRRVIPRVDYENACWPGKRITIHEYTKPRRGFASGSRRYDFPKYKHTRRKWQR